MPNIVVGPGPTTSRQDG